MRKKLKEVLDLNPGRLFTTLNVEAKTQNYRRNVTLEKSEIATVSNQ